MDRARETERFGEACGPQSGRPRGFSQGDLVPHRDGSAPELDPAPGFPGLQVLIHDLARYAQKARKVLLRDLEFYPGLFRKSVRLCQSQQPLCQACGCIEERRIFYEAARPAKPLTAESQ